VSNGKLGNVGEAALGAVKSVGVPVATAAVGAMAGVAGGVILGSKRPRKVLGITVPGSKNGLASVAKEVNGAGKQFGKLASEVGAVGREIREARERAKEIGKALT
jgi:hypothetical protein